MKKILIALVVSICCVQNSNSQLLPGSGPSTPWYVAAGSAVAGYVMSTKNNGTQQVAQTVIQNTGTVPSSSVLKPTLVGGGIFLVARYGKDVVNGAVWTYKKLTGN